MFVGIRCVIRSLKMLKVYLVYRSDTDGGDGMGGGCGWGEAKMQGAFTSRERACNWVRSETKKLKGDWRTKYSYKTLKVL